MTGSDVRQQRTRHATGITGLDKVIHGGLLSGSVYIIRGTPGAGKTITANQICFHWASQGERCLYVTLLSESHDRLIENLSSLNFYSEDKAENIHYLSGFHTLEEEGLTGILRMLMGETKRYDSCVVVLDGLFALQEKVDSDREFRLFMNQLQNLAHLTGSIMLLLTNSERGTGSPEYTMVDGWLEVAVEQHGQRTLRFLQVNKLRGSGFIEGQHALVISDKGVDVLPRLESIEDRPPPSLRQVEDYVSTGVAGLDTMMNSGLRCSSTTLVVGPTGSGKTVMGLQFLSPCSDDEPGLFFGFYESQDDLVEKARVLGISGFCDVLAAGKVEVIWHPPTEHHLDELAYTLINAVRRRGVKRLFIDSIDALQQSAVHRERVGRFLSALANVLRNEGVTCMYTMEAPELIGGVSRTHFTALSAVAQNLILLRYVEFASELRRVLTIIKARTSPFDASLREYHIGDGGIVLGDRFANLEGVLSGHAHANSSAGAGADE